MTWPERTRQAVRDAQSWCCARCHQYLGELRGGRGEAPMDIVATPLGLVGLCRSCRLVLDAPVRMRKGRLTRLFRRAQTRMPWGGVAVRTADAARRAA